MASNSNSRILLVPAGDDDVPISLDELPSMDDDEWEVIISLLTGESHSSNRPDASLWTRMAFEYLQTNREDHAIELLTKGTQILRGTETASNLHSMLSFYFLNKVKTSPKTILNNPRYQDLKLIQEIKEKAYHLNDSTKHSVNATTLAGKNLISILNKALLLLENGKNDECINQLEIILNSQPRHTVALFAKACILLRKKNYQSALLIYQSLLRLTLDIDKKAKQRRESRRMEESGMDLDDHQEGEGGGGWKGPDPRIGIGLCLLGLNRPSDAIRAWERAAALNPNSSAPNLLLGLTALNTAKQLAPLQPGAYGYSPSFNNNGDAGLGGCSEEEARQKAYKDGIDHIQKAWKGDNKNAMTAIILAEHISSRASSLASTSQEVNNSDIMNQFNKALKLCEHAIQYADNRPALIQASLIFARTSHLASDVAANAFDPVSSTSMAGGEMGNESVELRAQAQRNYQRVIDDLLSQSNATSNSLSATSASSSSQSLNVVGSGNVLPNGLALAILGSAQLQVLRNEELAAMNTLDLLLSRNWSNSTNYPLSTLLEPNILASSLRYFSHPGASVQQKSSDFLRAKIGLERTLRIINATCREVYLRLNSDESLSEENEESKKFKVEISKEEEEEEKTWESRRIVEGINDNVILSRAVSRTPLVNEPLSLNSFKNIASLFNSTKLHVLMAQLCQRGQSDSDIERSIQEWRVAAEKESSRLGIDLNDLKNLDNLKDEDLNDLVCCLINQNALLVLKGLEEKSDWDPLAKPNDDKDSSQSRSNFSNPVRTEILTEAVQNLEVVLELLSKIEASKPIASSTSQYFSSAISGGSNQLEVEPLRLIVSYNLARALEGLAEEVRAVKIYDEILEKHSEYTDAKVRKALIYLGASSKSYSSKDGVISPLLYSSKQGSSPSKLVSNWNKDLSNSLFKEALLSNPSSLSIRLSYVSFLSGSLPCSKSATWSIVKDILAEPFLGSNSQGIQLFGSANTAKTMAETARKDSFTLAALGWVYYNLALQARPGPNFKKEKEKGMLRSSDLFDKALTEDSRNCFAAQGLAILLAEDAIGEATFNAVNSGSLASNSKDPKVNIVNQQLLGQVKYLTGMNVEQRRKLGADESLSILGKLRELKDSEHVQICIGHANMMKEEFERAAKAVSTWNSKLKVDLFFCSLRLVPSRLTFSRLLVSSNKLHRDTSAIRIQQSYNNFQEQLSLKLLEPPLSNCWRLPSIISRQLWSSWKVDWR